ncbi:6498_t:CDS:2 [Ambispora leptoticha]|uniref:6498_t:CDS:1 n=1 Tax=Ambispora leptoticha TaxID=144679 RepID=A0A9N9FXH2_9GLOM|nr:6498_t:CDS:2 [Ambispora leptoticha]
MFNDQLFDDVTGEDNMSFEYEGISNFEEISNFENNLYENIVRSLLITSYFTSREGPTKKSSNLNVMQKKKTKPGSSWVWKYTRRDKVTKVKHCDVCIYNDNGTFKKCTIVFMSRTSTTNIAAHLYTEHQIFKPQKWKAQPPLTSTTIPTATNQRTIEIVIQKHIENASPLPEKQQNRIAYRLVAWIVEKMIPLNCINHDRF